MDSLLSLSCRTLSRRTFPPRHTGVGMLSLFRQPLHLCPRLLQTRLQSLLSTKGCRTGARPHPHPVLSHTLQTDRSCGHQRTYGLGQKVVQRLLVRYSEVREHVIVDRYVTPHPAVGIVLLAQTRQPAGAPYTIDRGQQPQPQQHLGVRRWATGPVHHRLDRLIEGRQVQPLHKAPDNTGRMILRQQRLQVHRRPLKLMPHRTQHPRLPGTRWCRPRPLLNGRKFKQRPFTHALTSSRWIRTIVHQSAYQPP